MQELPFIDITVTAALRPDLAETTAKSVRRFLVAENELYSRFRVIVNIDPVGVDGVTQADVEAVYREIFDDVTVYKPASADFPMAVRRVWQAVRSKLVFHAEDSKLLVRPIPVQRIIDAFGDYEDLATVSLCPLKKSHLSPRALQYDQIYDLYLSAFFRKAVTLQPSFFSRQYVHEMAELLHRGFSPEKTIKGFPDPANASVAPAVHERASRYRFGSISSAEETDGVYFENVGRQWRLKHRLVKPAAGGMTLSWARQRSVLPNGRYWRLWKEVRGRQLRRLRQRLIRVFTGSSTDQDSNS